MSARGPVATGMLALIILVLGCGVWAALSQIGGAVVASGVVEVDQNHRVVQHLNGGVVSEIFVRDGDLIQAGDAILRLDDTAVSDELGAMEAVERDLLAQATVLSARILQAEHLEFDPRLLMQSETDAEVASLLAFHRQQHSVTQHLMGQRDKQLRLHHQQVGIQLNGLDAAMAAQRRQLDLIEAQLRDQVALRSQGLVPERVVLTLEREKARLEGTLGQLKSDRAAAQSTMSEVRLQESSRRLAARQEDMAALGEINRRLVHLKREIAQLNDTFAKMVLRAPVSGIVLGMRVNTPKAVIGPGQVVLHLVPQEGQMLVATQIVPQQISNVSAGQVAEVHLPGPSSDDPVIIMGKVARISADVVFAEGAKMAHYRVDVELPRSMSMQARDAALLPGMPVEVFFQLKTRSALTYLLEPVNAYFTRAFRES